MLNYPGTSGGKRKDEDLFEDELAQFDRQARKKTCLTIGEKREIGISKYRVSAFGSRRIILKLCLH